MDLNLDLNPFAGDPLGSWLTLVLAVGAAFAVHRIVGHRLGDAGLRFGLAGGAFSGTLVLAAAYPRLALLLAPVLVATSLTEGLRSAQPSAAVSPALRSAAVRPLLAAAPSSSRRRAATAISSSRAA